MPGPFPADIITVIDGDTIQVRVIIWLDQNIIAKVRLAGIDTPEINGKCAAERELARKATAFVVQWLADSSNLPDPHTDEADKAANKADKQNEPNGTIALVNVRYGKYAGRVVANVQNKQGETLSTALLAAGLARPYNGKRASWCM